MSMGQVLQIIEAKLRTAFAPLMLEVVDDSARHAGHGAVPLVGLRDAVKCRLKVKGLTYRTTWGFVHGHSLASEDASFQSNWGW